MEPANRLTLLESPRASVWYYPDTKIIHHQFRAFVDGDEFRNVLEKGLEAFQKYGAQKWLSDDRSFTVTTADDSEWANNDWSPRVIAAGWTHWAVVMPEKVIGQMNLKRWIKTYADKGVTVSVFTSPEEARAWLEKQ